MSKPTALTLDTLDDRREIWHLLRRLHPRARVRWLAWCCARVTVPGAGTHPEPSYRRMRGRYALALREDRADEAFTNEIYMDVFMLAHQHGLDLGEAAAELVRRVKWAERA